MKKMIVGINYTQDGQRTIAFIEFLSGRSDKNVDITAKYYRPQYDEVYFVDFDPNCEDFINEIVLKGCRV